jgi:hypothetical protein
VTPRSGGRKVIPTTGASTAGNIRRKPPAPPLLQGAKSDAFPQYLRLLSGNYILKILGPFQEKADAFHVKIYPVRNGYAGAKDDTIGKSANLT